MNSNVETKQLLGWIFFAIVGFAALILGVAQAGRHIRDPFLPNEQAIANLRAQANAEAIDRTKDTDGDGLADYDELTIYKTSAYIKDSDSDGLDDKTEIENGSDPNCPQGKNCQTTPPPSAPVINTELPSSSVNSSTDEFFQNLNEPTTDMENLLENINAADLRTLLKQIGINEETLNKFTDDEIMELYRQSLENTNVNSNTP